jgi:hypothetical protein
MLILGSNEIIYVCKCIHLFFLETKNGIKKMSFSKNNALKYKLYRVKSIRTTAKNQGWNWHGYQ